MQNHFDAPLLIESFPRYQVCNGKHYGLGGLNMTNKTIYKLPSLIKKNHDFQKFDNEAFEALNCSPHPQKQWQEK